MGRRPLSIPGQSARVSAVRSWHRDDRDADLLDAGAEGGVVAVAGIADLVEVVTRRHDREGRAEGPAADRERLVARAGDPGRAGGVAVEADQDVARRIGREGGDVQGVLDLD